MTDALGFPPVASEHARVLVLGSMPGKISLGQQQYYAHPRNAFWPIMEALFGLPPGMSYQQRLDSLIENRIALWDVLATCYRPGSLDSSIDEQSIVVNDFVSFYGQHLGVRAIFFNGAKAEQVYHKYVTPSLPEQFRKRLTCRLPSTSPANARLNLAAKAELWRVVYDHAQEP